MRVGGKSLVTRQVGRLRLMMATMAAMRPITSMDRLLGDDGTRR